VRGTVQCLHEGALAFEFPGDRLVCRLDGTRFFQKRLQSFAKAPDGPGSKSVDLVAVAPDDDAVWLIEVKDYRAAARTKPTDLIQEVAKKVRDSLACIHAMAANAGEDAQAFAAQALRRRRLRVVLHLEQPKKPSKLKPWVLDPATMKQKVRRALQAVDPHALAGGYSVLNEKTPWQVR
jgi:hypothetical protein